MFSFVIYKTDVNVTFNCFNHKEQHTLYYELSTLTINDGDIDYFSCYGIYGRVKNMLSICDAVYYADIKTSRDIHIRCFLLQPPLNAKYRNVQRNYVLYIYC